MKELTLAIARIFFNEEDLQHVQHLFPITKQNHESFDASGINTKRNDTDEGKLITLSASGNVVEFLGRRVLELSDNVFTLTYYPVTSKGCVILIKLNKDGTVSSVLKGGDTEVFYTYEKPSEKDESKRVTCTSGEGDHVEFLYSKEDKLLMMKSARDKVTYNYGDSFVWENKTAETIK